MTEEEAKDRRCCGPEGCGTTHSSYIDQWGYKIRSCVGSQCMAWRWQYDDYRPTGGDMEQTNSGYCGLAGRPF